MKELEKYLGDLAKRGFEYVEIGDVLRKIAQLQRQRNKQ